MKLIVANRDRSADLGREIADAAKKLTQGPGPSFLSPQHSALSLCEAPTESKYLAQYMALLRIRPGIDTALFDVPRKPGFLGKVSAGFKAFLWRLLRYQHDRMAFQQSVINELLSVSVDFEKAARIREIDALDRRIAELERRLAEDSPKGKKK